MRILKVKFKNLNSLTGEWEIDFSSPAFSSSGIFAITGPTGAGKSTILDAICLSLYGRTPRLNKVTKSTNEIMSRQTGECFAETIFETRSGKYKCNWSQRRARKKPDGELQNPRHEISDPDNSNIYDTSLKGVAEHVATVTGMDFDRFTRSMLLAQGGFAAFLQASPDERSPILEDITGTGIYTRISIMVHERRSEERSKLDLLQAELNGIQLLSEDDENNLKKDLELKNINVIDIEGRIVKNKQSILWIDGIACLEKEILLIEGLRQELDARISGFQPEKDKLTKALKALELSADYTGLVSLRQVQETDCKNLGYSRQLAPEIEKRLQVAWNKVDSATCNLEKGKVARKVSLDIIKKVRELDVLIREKDAPIKTVELSVSEIQRNIESLCKKNEENRSLLASTNKKLENIISYQSNNRADESLVENLAGIKEKIETLKSLEDLNKTKKTDSLLAAKKKEDAQNFLAAKEGILQKLKKELETLESSSVCIQDKLSLLLAGKELSEWRDEQIYLKDRCKLLENVREAILTRSIALNGVEDLNKNQSKLAEEKDVLSSFINEFTKEQSVLEREVHLLETQVLLLKKIESFEEARKKLQDNQQCPLCGSLDHPFAAGNIPIPDEAVQSLEASRHKLMEISTSLSNSQIRDAEISTEIIQNSSRQKELEDRLKEINELLSAPDKASFIDTSECDLSILVQQAEEELKSKSDIIMEAEAQHKKHSDQYRFVEKLRKNFGEAELEFNTALHRKKSAKDECDRIQKELSDLSIQTAKLTEEISEVLNPYSIPAFSINKSDSIISDMIFRRKRWLDSENQKHDLEKNAISLGQDVLHLIKQIARFESELKEKAELLEVLVFERKALMDKRLDVFEEKDPDREDVRLNQEIEDFEKQLEEAQKTLNSISNEFGSLKTKIDELEKTILARTKELKITEDGFGNRLSKNGFLDEADYIYARLSENDRRSIAEKAELLIKEQSELEARHRNCVSKLESEKLKKLTEESADTLVHDTSALERISKELQQEIYLIRLRLDSNELQRQKQQERIGYIASQKKECSRWDKLHELIGSSDGKKYRNFVQGLTFEIMVRHANRQLKKMTDRYLLLRDRVQPLELNVIDSYQAGEIRSTKNLSGGESFIVSLALALGLSHMSSKNVRVDSLFLDEGFGTLDEDALDMALETLASLQQDGKLIGVISHVHGLKERISTQIQVLPMTGGRSSINGPGCVGL